MIFVTGDTHTGWMSRLCSDAFPEGRHLTKDDLVIILGDFGIWDNSKREKNDLDWLENKPWTTLFVDGNHENFDILDGLPVSEWNGGKVHAVRPSVLHLMRGQVFRIPNGLTIWAFGGASSHDISDGSWSLKIQGSKSGREAGTGSTGSTTFRGGRGNSPLTRRWRRAWKTSGKPGMTLISS